MSTIVYPIKVCKLAFKNYCYLVINQETREALLIDPAWEFDKIEQQLALHQVTLKTILLTHHHFDHVNLAETFAQKYQIPVKMSKIESDYYDFSCSNLQPIEQPDVFYVGQIKILPLLTPGHTKGAISYWIDNALFTGDTLFIEGCGICNTQGGDPNEMFDSLQRLKEIIPPETHIYPGHSYGQEPGKPFAYLLHNNIYLQFTKKEDFIAFRMREGQKRLFTFM